MMNLTGLLKDGLPDGLSVSDYNVENWTLPHAHHLPPI